jgi:asparagine synthase (glutamine-hydrolysing)
MCGICGIVAPGGVSRSAVGLMSDAIRHRGPDDEGFYSDGVAALGHRRLSIIDLAGGHQPLTNEDGSLWIVFNGEIYNYRELRDRLVSAHRFATHSDTEVVLHLYEERRSASRSCAACSRSPSGTRAIVRSSSPATILARSRSSMLT